MPILADENNFNDANDDIYFEQIIDTLKINPNLGPCKTTLINNLINLPSSTNANLSKVLDRLNLNINFPHNYSFEILSAATLNSNPGGTVRNQDSNGNDIPFSYTIKINPTYLATATKMGVARVIIHEMIHAYLLSLIDDNTFVVSNINDQYNYNILFNTIETLKYGNLPPSFQHSAMSQSFIPAIRDALQALDNNAQSQQYYQDLAWGGLQGTPTYLQYFPVNSIAEDRVVAINQAEDTNMNVNSNNNGIITPKSTPCN